MTPAEDQQRYFPGEPLLLLEGHLVPKELKRPVQALLAEIEHLRGVVAVTDERKR